MMKLWLVEGYGGEEGSRFEVLTGKDEVEVERNNNFSKDIFPYVTADEISEVDGYKVLLVPTIEGTHDQDVLDYFDDLVHILIHAVGKQRGYDLSNDVINSDIIYAVRDLIHSEVAKQTDNHILLAPTIDDIVENSTLKVGDQLYVDDNETYTIIEYFDDYALVDLQDNMIEYDTVALVRNTIEELIGEVFERHYKVDIIKKSTVKENSGMEVGDTFKVGGGFGEWQVVRDFHGYGAMDSKGNFFLSDNVPFIAPSISELVKEFDHYGDVEPIDYFTVENSTVSGDESWNEVFDRMFTKEEEDMNKVENSTLNKKDELLLYMLFDVVTAETEYCFSLGYNNDKHWTVKERMESLIGVISQYKDLPTEKAIHELIKNHGYDYFESINGFDNDYTSLFGDYDYQSFKVGNKFKVEKFDDTYQIVIQDSYSDGEPMYYNLINTDKFTIFFNEGYENIVDMLRHMENMYGKATRIKV